MTTQTQSDIVWTPDEHYIRQSRVAQLVRRHGIDSYQDFYLRRFGTSEDRAKAVRFLCADGDYITGEVISVNGGVYM